MLFKTNVRSFFAAFFVFLILGCSDSIEYKADSMVGYWQVLRKTNLSINGIPSDPTERGYYIRFFENNCGELYDRDENWEKDLKWAFQENSEKQDRLILSTALNSSSGESTELHQTSINYIERFEEMNFLTFSFKVDTIGDDVYNWGYLTNYTRQ